MKNQKLLLTLTILIFCTNLFSQQSIMFDKQFVFDNHGSYPKDLKQTPDGGYICGGGIGFGMYDVRYLLFKTDSIGELEWYKYQDSPSINSDLWAIDITKTGNYVGIGCTQDNDDWHKSGAIVMYDSMGDTLWTKQYAFDNPFIQGTKYKIWFYDGQFTSDNCIIAGGGVISNESGDTNPILVKTTLQGDTLWTWRLFEEENHILIKSVAETSEGDYIAVGTANTPIIDETRTFAPMRGFIVKLSQNGELIYLKEWTDINYNLFDEVVINSAGELLIAGSYFYDPPEYPNYYALLVKTDENGETIFYKQIEYSRFDSGLCVVSDLYSNIYIFDMFTTPLEDDWHYDILLQKYSDDGCFLWQKSIGGQESTNWPYAAIATNDGGVAFCGLYSYQQNYSWLVKIDSLGNGTYGQGWINAIELLSSIDDILIYPNPADNEVSIELQQIGELKEIEIFDINGKLLKRQVLNNNKIVIEDLQNGIYFIKIFSNDNIIVKKLVVQH
jgi:hypothetical protein